MTNTPLIIWEKWQDPLLNHIISNENIEDTNTYEDHENDDGIEHETTTHKTLLNKYPIIITPMGILPYYEQTACDSFFNFWIGNTNFSITKKISDILEQIDGIETLDVFTRYRFRVGIGRAFKDSKVMRNINSIIYTHINERQQ